MDFSITRSKLLEEAKASPNLLSDLAGLENYIGESYNNRSFIELLQNADDANSSKFKIVKQNGFLFVANDGREFSNQDLESLCRSASSGKIRGNSIGYRGIGFKSVVSFAKEIHVISGDLEFTFSKDKTALEIPHASQVPLIRIPHELHEEDKRSFASVIMDLKNTGYTTIFVFSGVTAHEIELEFNAFNVSSLLFLRNICETNIGVNKARIEKSIQTDGICKVTIATSESNSSWLIFNRLDTSIAFALESDVITKLDEKDSLVYAFLPTEDQTGLGVLINGDFSTDPSRKHLIYDSKTLQTLKSCAEHILFILEGNIRNNINDDFEMINALIPFMDARMLQFKKPSFEKYLLEELRENGNRLFSNLRIAPGWLNIKDYSLLTTENSENQINPKYFSLDGATSFAKYLGAIEDSFDSFKSYINSTEISTLGCVQLSVHIFKDIISKSNGHDPFISGLKVLKGNEERISLNQLKSENYIIDKSFISLLIENGLTESDVKLVLGQFLTSDHAQTLFEVKESSVSGKAKDQKKEGWFDNLNAKSFPATKSNVYRWRSAEEDTLEMLNSKGFNLADVSKQNIGYDLEGFDPDGKEIQIEIKSITKIGEKFKLTNNEIAVAQEKKKTYYVAIVRLLDNFIEIALVQDPVNNLILNRQCVQWIWECSDYDYNPIRFEI